MPEMDGFEATAAIRACEKRDPGRRPPAPDGQRLRRRPRRDGRIPIVALTAHAMKGDEERCLAARMDGYVSKPVRAETLDAALAPFIPAAAVAIAEDARAAIDRAAALRAVGGDEALLTDLMQLFLEDCPGASPTCGPPPPAGTSPTSSAPPMPSRVRWGRSEHSSPAISLRIWSAPAGRDVSTMRPRYSMPSRPS